MQVQNREIRKVSLFSFHQAQLSMINSSLLEDTSSPYQLNEWPHLQACVIVL